MRHAHHFEHLKSWPIHSITDTSEDPRKSPRNPPTAEIRPSWFMTKYSFLVSMVKSADLNLRKNFPATNSWFCLVANNLAFSCLFLSETSKLEVLQGLIHLDGFLEEYKIVARCTLWRLWFSWSLVTFLQMLVSFKYFPTLTIAEEHSKSCNSLKAHWVKESMVAFGSHVKSFLGIFSSVRYFRVPSII